jgi:hypothetical protein
MHRFPLQVAYLIGPPSSSDPPLLVALVPYKKRPGYWFGRVAEAERKKRKRKR